MSLFSLSFTKKKEKKEDNLYSGAGLDCLRDWTNNVQPLIPIYVAERDYEVWKITCVTTAMYTTENCLD